MAFTVTVNPPLPGVNPEDAIGALLQSLASASNSSVNAAGEPHRLLLMMMVVDAALLPMRHEQCRHQRPPACLQS